MNRCAQGFRIRCAMLATSFSVGAPQTALPSNPDEIPPYTLELERRVQPWCPGECVLLIPFTATYRKSGHVLVFVGTRHVFTPQNPTIRAVDFGFSAAKPKMVIVEGFPTGMGESPAPLVEQAKTRGTPQA